jgi:hypothetical protein
MFTRNLSSPNFWAGQLSEFYPGNSRLGRGVSSSDWCLASDEHPCSTDIIRRWTDVRYFPANHPLSSAGLVQCYVNSTPSPFNTEQVHDIQFSFPRKVGFCNRKFHYKILHWTLQWTVESSVRSLTQFLYDPYRGWRFKSSGFLRHVNCSVVTDRWKEITRAFSPRKPDCCCAVSIGKYRCYRRCSWSTVYWTLLSVLEVWTFSNIALRTTNLAF